MAAFGGTNSGRGKDGGGGGMFAPRAFGRTIGAEMMDGSVGAPFVAAMAVAGAKVEPAMARTDKLAMAQFLNVVNLGSMCGILS
jgi:hypothetical protein